MNKIDLMKHEIAKLTGLEPKSLDEAYLARRLAALRQRKTDGRKAEKRYGDASVVVAVSMHAAIKDAIVRIAGGEKVGVSELVRLAVAEYAQKRGYKNELAHFEEV